MSVNIPSGPGEAGRAADAVASKSNAPRRSKRWLRRLAIALGILFLLLVGVVGFAPTLASIPAVSNYGLSLANDKIRGKLALGGLGLSWGGPQELTGVRVTDIEGREVLSIEKLTVPKGLLALLNDYYSFGDITIDAPQVQLLLNEHNEPSLAEAFSLRTPSPGTPPGKIPDLRGRILVRNARIKTSRNGGPTYEVSDCGVDFDLQTLDNVKSKLTLKTMDGVAVSVDAAIMDLVRNGGISADSANGTLQIASAGEIQLDPLMQLLAPELGLAGAMKVDVNGNFVGGAFDGRFEVAINKLQTAERAAARSVPLDLLLKGSGSRNGAAIAAKLDLNSDAVVAVADLKYRLGGNPPKITVDQLLSAILTGQSLNLPDFSLDANGAIDLAKLQRAVPGILNTRPGQEITAGKIAINNLSVHGGARPTAKGSLEITELTATDEGRAVAVNPVSLTIDATLEPDKGLILANTELKSSFAQLTVQGAASNLKLEFRSDLAKMRQELGQLVDLSQVEMSGALNGTVEMARVDPARVNLTLRTSADGLHYASKSRVFDLQKLSLAQDGFVTLAENRVTRLDVSNVMADAAGQLLIDGSGFVDFQKGGFGATVDMKQADLGFIAARARPLGIDALDRYSGGLTMQATAERAAKDQPIVTNGSATTHQLVLDGEPILETDSKIHWNHVQISPGAERITADSAKLDSAAATVDARSLSLEIGQALNLSADVDASADLEKAMRVLARIAKLQSTPAIQGRFSMNGKLATVSGLVTIAGRGGIDDLAFGAGAQTVREKRLTFDVDARLDQPREQLSLARCQITSTPLTAELTGTIDQYRSSRVLSLKGRYDAGWDQLSTLLHEFVPATAQTIVVKGTSSSSFEIIGPLNESGAQPPFRSLKTTIDIGWTSAEVYGVGLGQAKLSPRLESGQLTLPPTAIAASSGRINLAGQVDLTATDPLLRVPGNLALLDGVAITPEMGTKLLSYINPIFMHLTRVEGRVSLNTFDLSMPLGDSIKKSGGGRGTLDLQNMKIQPGGLFGELADLAGMKSGDLTPVQFGKLDFVIREGRIVYDNFVMNLPPQFDLIFRGSVGLDSTLDLIVSVPVNEGLLRKLGVRGPAAEYAKALSGMRVDIPIVGTREQPQFDLSKVDVDGLLKGVLQSPEAPEKAVESILKGLKEATDKPR